MAENVKVRCGEFDKNGDSEKKTHQERSARHISVHPIFNAKTLHNDVALVHVFSNFTYDDHVSPICLPSEFDLSSPWEFNTFYAMGFGTGKFGKYVAMVCYENYDILLCF